ncbi:MBL fold metallo-hydrolase [Candidatus Uhrbacteria bacterium]|nr:MBL fold metallo-hydrolase [Candidatus Uhrbacteria bacterium]
MRLTFFGATESVTGSCFLVETNGSTLLVDCGAVQGERMCSKTNLEDFPFDPKAIDAVLVTHAHFDHTGRLPKLVRDGFAGPIFSTAPTKSISEIVLEDSLTVMRENAEKCGDGVPYEEEDIVAALGRMKGIGYHTEFEPARHVRAMFHDAGHILGSSFVSLDIPGEDMASGNEARIVFSGDIGNDNVPILPDTDAIEHADIVVCESTYGAKDHDPVETRGKDLAAFVQEVIGRGGTLLIPAFSVERTQELLYELDLLLEARVIPEVPIYLDSPLAIKATELYRHYKAYLRFDHPASKDGDFFSFRNLRETLTVQESTLIDTDRRPKIVIAGNGMMTGGRILRHLKSRGRRDGEVHRSVFGARRPRQARALAASGVRRRPKGLPDAW